MIELQGKYAKASVYTDNIESEAISQIIELCNQDFIVDSKVAIMPDCHSGKGCVIGFTADLGDKVIPNIVGLDLGCGILTVELGKMDIELHHLDRIINDFIPAGFDVHDSRQVKFPLTDLHCYRDLKDSKRIERSIGTLGGGNHFIELNEDGRDLYLVIHSGSRNLGKQVAEFYQEMAVEACKDMGSYHQEHDDLIQLYKETGRSKSINKGLKELKKKYENIHPKHAAHLCYLEGELREKYLHDMRMCQEYASLSRQVMADIILGKLNGSWLSKYEHFETIHNYISPIDNIIRKGAVAAYEGEKLIIPINMRDGSIIAIGKGNPDWNYSAPHGAGRLMSRSKAKELLNMEDYKATMKGIYTTSVVQSTLDEAPMAYKPMQEIIDNIGDTVEIVSIIKPLYNFKSS